MIWRLGWFAAGLPLGWLAVRALAQEAGLPAHALGALAGGGLALALTAGLARAAAPERGRRLGIAAAAGGVALPGVLGDLLGLAPGAGGWLAISGLALALALVWALRGSDSTRIGPWAALALASVAGTLAAVGIGGVLAAAAPGPPAPPERRTEYIYDLDARVPTGALPRCSARVAHHRVLLTRGARPRLDATGNRIWYDALDSDGMRQVFVYDRDRAVETCWTCGEPGNNLRPFPGPRGNGVVYDTDRHATASDPTNTEVYLASARGAAPRRGARRLTHHPGPDDHALLDPGGQVLVWSQGEAGAYGVVTAAIQSGHGGIVLGRPTLLVREGAAWVAPVAWSATGRAFAVVSGQPFAPARARLFDYATGSERDLGFLLPEASVSFSADGDWVALVSVQPRGALARMPGRLGFLGARLATALGLHAPRVQGARVSSGPSHGTTTPIELGPLSEWGTTTGVALDADGAGFVLGQRRREGVGGEERLVEVELECDPAS